MESLDLSRAPGAPPTDRNLPDCEEILWQSRDGWLRLGEFAARPDRPDFATVGAIRELPAIAFGRTTVTIAPSGSEPFLSDSTVAVLHRPGRPYRRSAVHPEGDLCHWINASDELLAELGLDWPGAARGEDRSWVRLSARALVLLRWSVAAARAGRIGDREIGQALAAVLSLVLGRNDAARSPGKEGSGTEAIAVQRARRLLGLRLGEKIPLRELAREAGCSGGYLSRAFKARVGLPPHRFHLELRLREAIARLALTGGELSGIAHELGFSSHSHFTQSFRSRFGVPPSVLRRAAEEGDPSALRRLGSIVRAPPLAQRRGLR